MLDRRTALKAMLASAGAAAVCAIPRSRPSLPVPPDLRVSLPVSKEVINGERPLTMYYQGCGGIVYGVDGKDAWKIDPATGKAEPWRVG